MEKPLIDNKGKPRPVAVGHHEQTAMSDNA